MRLFRAGKSAEEEAAKARFEAFADKDAGLLQGALVLTLDGERRVEDLAVGDRLITRDTGMSKVLHIQSFHRAVPVISIARAALGPERPLADARLAADQMVLVRGWGAQALFESEQALAAARGLTDFHGVEDIGPQQQTLYQVFCDAPHILFCDGLELATADGARARGDALSAA